MPREKPLAVGTTLTSPTDQYHVKRLVGGGGQGVDPVFIGGVDEDLRVVHGTDVHVAHPLPRHTGVL